MNVEITQDTSWKRALNEARRTVGKEPIDKEPSKKWKLKSLIAEHSHIKLVEYTIHFKDLKQWIGVHLLRHPFTLPFIHSQRDDRRDNPVPRDEMPQGSLNDQDFVVNAQSLINISRKRLCRCASKETRETWEAVKNKMKEIDPEMASVMVPNCVYRGFCPEMKSCGYVKTTDYKSKRQWYVNLTQTVGALDGYEFPNRYGAKVTLKYLNEENDIEYYKLILPDDVYRVSTTLIENNPNEFSFIDWDGGAGYHLGSELFASAAENMFITKTLVSIKYDPDKIWTLGFK